MPPPSLLHHLQCSDPIVFHIDLFLHPPTNLCVGLILQRQHQPDDYQQFRRYSFSFSFNILVPRRFLFSFWKKADASKRRLSIRIVCLKFTVRDRSFAISSRVIYLLINQACSGPYWQRIATLLYGPLCARSVLSRPRADILSIRPSRLVNKMHVLLESKA